MKFSQKKKAKIRKRNQRRIHRVFKYMIDYTIDYELKEVVIDQAKISGEIYLLTQNMYNQYAIWKIINVHNFVKLSAKKILKNQRNFMNHAYWNMHSTIIINEYGEIEEIKRGTIWGPYNQKKRNFDVRIIIADK